MCACMHCSHSSPPLLTSKLQAHSALGPRHSCCGALHIDRSMLSVHATGPGFAKKQEMCFLNKKSYVFGRSRGSKGSLPPIFEDPRFKMSQLSDTNDNCNSPQKNSKPFSKREPPLKLFVGGGPVVPVPCLF